MSKEIKIWDFNQISVSESNDENRSFVDSDDHEKAFKAARVEEREACAKIVEGFKTPNGGIYLFLEDVASKLRERGS